ncbi:putative integral membrane protein [Jezberella montanilacus]|uniref:Putative integral membrane protein n=1 Tax=Jezberella montanilacus TaxID=323426 RepID=A0A2T0XK41_9BURK|nr:lipopolysaccharide assembly protein LapA domain-containing protein [Jezberella montanilacus]PRY99303.1 putative integral membrane protein [Jezberella montanilacus]
MRYLVWALRFVVFSAVLLFALNNTDEVTVKIYGDLQFDHVHLIVVMLAAFVVGTLFGLLLTVPGSLRRRREIMRLRKDIERIQKAVNPSTNDSVSPDVLLPLSPF